MGRRSHSVSPRRMAARVAEKTSQRISGHCADPASTVLGATRLVRRDDQPATGGSAPEDTGSEGGGLIGGANPALLASAPFPTAALDRGPARAARQRGAVSVETEDRVDHVGGDFHAAFVTRDASASRLVRHGQPASAGNATPLAGPGDRFRSWLAPWRASEKSVAKIHEQVAIS